MNNRSKLRMSVGLFYPIAIFCCYILAILEWGIRRGLIHEGEAVGQTPFFTYYICGAFFFGMGIFQWFKYRLWIYPVLGFSRFIDGKYVAKAFHEDQTIFLALSLNRSLMTVSNPRDVSHISITQNGAMNVFISETDYREYRKTFTFNQLCHSMGSVFKRFMEYYQQGLENRIITELKTAR